MEPSSQWDLILDSCSLPAFKGASPAGGQGSYQIGQQGHVGEEPGGNIPWGVSGPHEGDMGGTAVTQSLGTGSLCPCPTWAPCGPLGPGHERGRSVCAGVWTPCRAGVQPLGWPPHC